MGTRRYYIEIDLEGHEYTPSDFPPPALLSKYVTDSLKLRLAMKNYKLAGTAAYNNLGELFHAQETWFSGCHVKTPKDELVIKASVYNGNMPDYLENEAKGLVQEWGPDTVPIKVIEADGVKIVLGEPAGVYDDSKGIILVERQHDKWAVFVHPDGGDPACYVYIHDSGVVTVNVDGQKDSEVLRLEQVGAFWTKT